MKENKIVRMLITVNARHRCGPWRKAVEKGTAHLWYPKEY